MAGQTKTLTFVCSCFFTNNIFLEKYKLHITYYDRSQFMGNYAQTLRNKGCVTEQQFRDVILEIENEISRRKELGEISLLRLRQRIIKEKYVPLHKEIYCLKEEYLDPAFVSLVSDAKRMGATASSLLEKMHVVGEETYTFPIFTEEFCQMFLEELENIEASDCPKERPNSMNKHGVLLGEYQFNEQLLDPLRCQYLNPLTFLLFRAHGGGRIDSHKAFAVTYEMSGDVDLSCHYDNAEVTLNVSLSHNHTGGDLYFRKMFDIKADFSVQTHSFFLCKHRLGWAVLHRGKHMHGASKVTSGKRCNLIMWMRASCVRNRQCPMCWKEPSLLHVPGVDDGFRCQDGRLRVLEDDGGGVAEDQSVDVCQVL